MGAGLPCACRVPGPLLQTRRKGEREVGALDSSPPAGKQEEALGVLCLKQPST